MKQPQPGRTIKRVSCARLESLKNDQRVRQLAVDIIIFKINVELNNFIPIPSRVLVLLFFLKEVSDIIFFLVSNVLKFLYAHNF